ncbi:MAG: glycosyltransferase family 2 protein [Chloroflexi bacterium]|nr:glycosyltransferase family 2 protein [Chloroflexota bacterium]
MADAEIEKPKADSPKTVAIIPAHNEERYIGSVVLQARKHVDMVIVVDDGSTDATAEIAEAAGAIVIRHPQNLGKGAALNTGFREARKLLPQAVVILDADGQHQAREIPSLMRPVLQGEADMVVGSRFLGVRSAIPRLRMFGMRTLTVASNLGSGVRVSDSQTGFRAFSEEAFSRIDFQSSGFSVESEMQFLAKRLGLRIVEVPISVSYTDAAKRNILAQGLEVLNGLLQLIGQHRPLLFFGVPGLAMLLFGLWWGYRVVEIYRKVQELAIGYALLAVLLCIVGSVILSTGITLHTLRALLLELVRPKE